MKRSHLVTLAVQAAVLFAVPAVGDAQAIGKAMGNLRWGMSDTDVARTVKTRMREQYEAKLKTAKGASKATLERELASKVKEVEKAHAIEFTGKRSRWDSTPIAGEFGYDSNESMLTFNDGESDNYYFFVDGNLWKWVRLYPASTFGGRNFSKFSSAIEKKFGKGYKKEAETNPGSGKKHTFLEFLDRQSRLRAVDRTGDANSYALVFEEMATVKQLASIRPNMPKAKPARVVEDEEEESAPVATQKPSKQRRSVFGGDDEQEETEDDYESRKKEVLAKKRDLAQRNFQRKEELKKGKDLDNLQAVEDDDPLSGI
jgi:hypothetical protein